MTAKPREPWRVIVTGPDVHAESGHTSEAKAFALVRAALGGDSPAAILERMRRRRANRPTQPATVQERMQAVHADAYTNWPTGDPICATCHNGNCPRYWRIQQRLDRQEAARRDSLLPALYGEEPW